MKNVDPANPDRDRQLASRLLALEESHTFLSRTLELLSGEVNHLGTALVALARRVDRLDDEVGRLDTPDRGPDGSPNSGPDVGPGDLGLDDQ